MNRLAQLIDAYNQGFVDLDWLKQELEFQDWQEKAEQGRKQNSLAKVIQKNMYNSYHTLYNESPEDIVLEMERQEEICKSLNTIREILGDRDYSILMCYAVQRMKHKTICRKYNLDRSTVTKILNSIHKRTKRYTSKNSGCSDAFSKENLLPNESTLEASAPTVNGYPFEFLQHISTTGKWVTYRGREKYKPLDVCLVPEYLEKSFGDKNTACTFCGDKCRRKETIN
jgi:hypothetical protein